MENTSLYFETAEYSQINRAIERELERSNEILKDYRHIRHRSWSEIILYITCASAILITSIALSYWIYKVANREPLITNDAVTKTILSTTPEEATEQINTLTELSKKDSTSISTVPDISSSIHSSKNENETSSSQSLNETQVVKTEFTVFKTIVTPSGEEVVTGKIFLPNNLSVPDSQYCYLNHLGNKNSFSGIYIARYRKDKIIYDSDDLDLRNIAAKYCRFELHKK